MSTTALDLPEGLYAIPDPHTPDTITYWRRHDVTTRRKNVRPEFGAWPPKAQNGPNLYTKDVPKDLHGQARAEWALAWYQQHRHPYLDAVVDAIASDPVGAGRRFAELTTRCCQCARALTDALSKTYGIGPDCREAIPTETLALYSTPLVGRAHHTHEAGKAAAR